MLVFIEWLCIAIGKMFILGKMGEEKWKGLVPFYSEYLIFKHCWNTQMFTLLALVSVGLYGFSKIYCMVSEYTDFTALNPFMAVTVLAGIVCLLLCITLLTITAIAAYKLAESFGHGILFTIGLLIFTPVFTLILGLGKDEFHPERGPVNVNCLAA